MECFYPSSCHSALRDHQELFSLLFTSYFCQIELKHHWYFTVFFHIQPLHLFTSLHLFRLPIFPILLYLFLPLCPAFLVNPLVKPKLVTLETTQIAPKRTITKEHQLKLNLKYVHWHTQCTWDPSRTATALVNGGNESFLRCWGAVPMYNPSAQKTCLCF